MIALTPSKVPMRALKPLLAACLVVTGCQTHLLLRDDTVKMATTVTDFQYQQVLNNVAMFVHNPSTIPSLVAVTAGTASVQDQKGYSGNATYAPTLPFSLQGGGALPILTLLFNPSVQRQVTENWSLVPISDIDHLRRIRCAFQLLVLDAETSHCDHCRDRLDAFFLSEAADRDCVIPHGWYRSGRKADVPKNACYVGCYESCYVWVMPDGLEGLARFTMTIMNLESGTPHLPTKTIVKTFKADGTLETRQETTTDVDQDVLEKLRKMEVMPDRPRKSPIPINPGLYFVPR
jgi:hypothetical protein